MNQGLHFEPGENTFWAPDLYRRKDSNSVTGIGATYHLHVTYIKASFRARTLFVLFSSFGLTSIL